ncbi:MAG: putative molybdopterin-dioxomolybdenum cytidylyltransferase [Bacteroidetes bacterium]|nr:putative molybdopterin-dioxomolybdenum cytidylyltransferase [Bacteroidota bacterium]
MSEMVAAIVLAAGQSNRMGCPKALLSFNGKTFIRGVVDLLTTGGLSPIVVVLGAYAGQVQNEVERLKVHVTINHAYRTGQLSSLRQGLVSVRRHNVTGVLVYPVDHPAVTAETVKTILDCFASTRAPVVVPTYKGRRGHPVIFSSALFDELDSGTCCGVAACKGRCGSSCR